MGQTIKFAGFIVDHKGNRPDPVKVEVLKNFPAPKDVTNLKSYLGLANELPEFTPDLKHTLEPLKPLLLPKNIYAWNPEMQSAFEKSKEVLCSEQVLKRFDPMRHTILITDASRIGLG